MCVWSLVNERIGSEVYRDETTTTRGRGRGAFDGGVLGGGGGSTSGWLIEAPPRGKVEIGEVYIFFRKTGGDYPSPTDYINLKKVKKVTYLENRQKNDYMKASSHA